jgi:cyclopropane-fatty-acyl-phospholipid synthase
MSAKHFITDLFAAADIRTDGSRPWDIVVHDEHLYNRLVSQGSIGLGESYMDGWWDCRALDDMFFRLLRADPRSKMRPRLATVLPIVRAIILNTQTRRRSLKVAQEHYDIGNDLYRAMLDPYMQYSCGYFKDTEDLAVAQIQKMDLICRKLQLKPGEHVLDIGCGWGGLARFMAERYKVRVTGITIAKEQVALARANCKGLDVEILEKDYRDLEGSFDKIVSVGMFEHVGYKNYRTYMEHAHRLLKEGGLFLLHSIASKHTVRTSDPWFEKYIFPNSMLPSVAQIGTAIDKLFILEDWQNFGVFYAKTLKAWHANFEKAWPALQAKYGDRFKRMWDYYLLSLPGGFRARNIHLWQIVLSKGGLLDGYMSPR